MPVLGWITVLSALTIEGFCRSFDDNDWKFYTDMDPSDEFTKYKKINSSVEVLVVAMDGINGIETVTVNTILSKAKIHTIFSGMTVKVRTVFCEYGVHIYPDADIELSMLSRPYALIVLPGGIGSSNYSEIPEMMHLIYEQLENKRLIGLMSSATHLLQKHNISAGKRIAVPPNLRPIMENHVVDEHARVVHDDILITCRSTGAAIEFSIHIVELFKGKQVADEIAEALGYRRNPDLVTIVQ